MKNLIIKKTRAVGLSTSTAITLAMLQQLNRDLTAATWPDPRVRRWMPDNRPRPASAVWDIAPMLYAARRIPDQPMTRGDALEVEAYSEFAYLNMVQGQGSDESWNMLAVAMNVAMVLAEMGLGEDHTEEIRTALDGLFAAKVRGERTGRWGFDGPAIVSVRRGLDVHIAQLEVATRREIDQARATVQQRVKEGLTYEVAPA